jgi:catechol 2,3-dioxygenase-like lactoylglutathione lyase family enzyme
MNTRLQQDAESVSDDFTCGEFHLVQEKVCRTSRGVGLLAATQHPTRRHWSLKPQRSRIEEDARPTRGSDIDPRCPAERAIFAIRNNGRVALQRMDNVGIVVESLDAAISFFVELGLELEGRAMIEGDWSGRVTGLRDQRVEMAMMRMPDGHGGIELSRFLTPPAVADHRNAPVNALGYLRVMFAVDDLDETLARLREHGAQLVDEVVQYEDVYRLCYVRGPEGVLIGLAEQIG